MERPFVLRAFNKIFTGHQLREALCGLLQIQQGTSPTRSLASWCHRQREDIRIIQINKHINISIEPSDTT